MSKAFCNYNRARLYLALNRTHCMARIRMENGIRRVRVFRIVKAKYRNRLKKHDYINDVVRGVVNQDSLLKHDDILCVVVAGRRGWESYDF